MSESRQAWVRRLLLPLMAAAASVLAGCHDCGGCSTKPVLAELIEASGGLVRTGAGEREANWKNADLGRRFEPGDSLQTDAHSSAKLRLPDGTVVIVHPATLIRFTNAGPGESPIEVITGEAIVTAGDHELRLHTHVGLAILRPGGSMRVARQGEALQLQLDVGEASFRRDNGEEVALTRGERVRIEVGKALIRERSKLGDAAGAGGTPPPSAAVEMHVDSAGVRSKSASDGAWAALPAGDHPVAGETELSLPSGTSVELTRERDKVKLLGAGDYRVGGHDLVWARRGKLLLSARSYDVSVAMADGWIVAPAAHGGSDAELELSERAGSLKVSQGSVHWQRGSEQGEATPEHPLRWSLDNNAAAAVGGEMTDLGPPSLSSRAGESFVLHAPQLPVTVEIDFSRACHGGVGVVELNTRKRARGQGAARVSVGADARGYTVRCLDERDTPGPVAVRGSVRVLKDAGTRDLPPKAPTSAVDTDGRSYTIYYQNQLPDVHVRWPDAPSAKQYKLDVDGNAQTVDAPEHTFASGSLRDGAHKITFSANQRRSRTSNVEIHFDNTATTASLSAPADRSFHAGDKVDIEGVALPSWKVSVDGGMIDKIGEDRFHGQVVTSEQHPDIAVRLAHPRLGTHYYLRRAAGSP